MEITLVTRVSPGLVPPGAISLTVPDTATVRPGPWDYDPTPEDNTVTVEAIITAQADLVATKSAAPDPVAAGSELTYTLGLRNTGPSNANDATVSDALPPNVQFLAARSSRRCVLGADNTVACHAGTLAPGESTTFRVVVLVSARLASQSMLGNVSWGDSDQFDPGDHRDSGVVITHVIGPSVTHVIGPFVPVTG